MEDLVKKMIEGLKFFNDIFRNKKVLITGDTGFKGSWLAIWLKELGADVYGYALPPQKEEDNFVKCNLYEKIHHVDGDVRNLNELLKYFEIVQPEFAFHMAAQPLVLESYKDPHYTFETNIMGTVNFFEAIRATKSVKAALNITSDKCYQNNEWVWGYRESDHMGGKDPYSASKGCSELVTTAYMNSFFSNDTHCSIASARAGNVIGGGDWAEYRIIPDFFRAIKNNEKLIIRNPNATRPWQHVLEPLSGYLILASKLYEEGNKYSGGWNLGPLDQANYKVVELIEAIIKYYGKGNVGFEASNEKLHEANVLKLDISKATWNLKWKPVLNFEELIEYTVDGYKVEMEEKELYFERVRQIEKYVELAKQRNINWAEKQILTQSSTKESQSSTE
ncbi:MAG: CDP-glucose 4,6-dehydratase [Elusimicrobiota bacterium]